MISKILKGLIELTRKWRGTVSVMYGTLGKALMWVASDEPNAKIAFARQMELLQKESSVHANNNDNSIQCARCHATSTSCSMKKWFVCKDYTDIDLCGDCVERFGRRPNNTYCCCQRPAWSWSILCWTSRTNYRSHPRLVKKKTL